MSQKSHFVYAIRAIESGRVKIGHAVNPANRVAALQTGSPETLALISGKRFESENDAVKYESLMHTKFAAHHIRDEWFQGAEPILAEVTSQQWLSPEDISTRSYRVPVLIDRDIYDRVKAYADILGIPVTRALNDLATDWMDTVGEARMESIQQKFSATVGSN